MTSLLCPVCNNQKMEVLKDSTTGLELDSCPNCLGVWFDAAELSEFYKSPELLKRLTPSGGGSLNHTYELSSRPRACPRCRKAMERPLVGGISVDVCRACRGIWFDDGELRKVTDIYKSRGLKGDDEVIDQVRQGMRGERSKGGGPLEVLGWFFNSFLSTKI